MSNEIRFYRATGAYGYLSNLYLHPMKFRGGEYRASEYAYQVGKPNKPEIIDWLMAAPTPSLCAQAAHALLPWQIVEGWTEKKVQRMRDVLMEKFKDADLQAILLRTGDAVLIEESKTDGFWGIGRNGKGRNMLGVLLVEVRNAYRKMQAMEGGDA